MQQARQHWANSCPVSQAVLPEPHFVINRIISAFRTCCTMVTLEVGNGARRNTWATGDISQSENNLLDHIRAHRSTVQSTLYIIYKLLLWKAASKACCLLMGQAAIAIVAIQCRFLPCCRCGGAQSQWLEQLPRQRQAQICRGGTVHLS